MNDSSYVKHTGSRLVRWAPLVWMLALTHLGVFDVCRAYAGPFADQAARIDVADNLGAIRTAGKSALPDLLAGAAGSHRKDLIALALGYTGDPGAAPALRKFAVDPDSEVRANTS
jgi:HEAT repeat protein